MPEMIPYKPRAEFRGTPQQKKKPARKKNHAGHFLIVDGFGGEFTHKLNEAVNNGFLVYEVYPIHSEFFLSYCAVLFKPEKKKRKQRKKKKELKAKDLEGLEVVE